MTRLMPLELSDETGNQIEHLVRLTGKPREKVLREVVETGLKSYQTAPTKGVKALINLVAWAEKNNVTGPADLSVNHNKYAWE